MFGLLSVKKISLCERLKNELALNLVTSEEIVSKEKVGNTRS